MALRSRKIDLVRQFLKSLNITTEPCIKVRQVQKDAEHIAAYATRNIAEGEPLACIPKDAVLSLVNTAAADILRSSNLRGGLALIFAVLYEIHVMGERSQWHAYLKSLPRRAYLPIFWTEEEAALLQGSEAEGRAAADRPLLAEDFGAVQALLDRHPDIPRTGFTLPNYMAAASWLSSRGFGVDDVHGYSLVPLADIFNHKAAYVRLTGDYVVAGDVPSSDDEGSSESNDGSGDNEEATVHRDICEPLAEGDAAEQSLQPSGGLEGSDHTLQSSDDEDDSTAAATLWRPSIRKADVADDPRWQLEIGILSSEREKQQVLEILAASDLAAGAEVHNCYGELSNCELVLKYGFALEGGNPFDTVSLDAKGLVAAAQRHLGKAAAKKRVAFLNDHSDLLANPQESLCIAPGGVLEAGLVAALWVLFAPPAAMAGADSMQAAAARLVDRLDAARATQDSSKTVNEAAKASEQQGARQLHNSGVGAAEGRQRGVGSGGSAGGAAANSEQASEDDSEAMLCNVPAAQAVAALPAAAAAALANSIRQRLKRYSNDGLEADESLLAVTKQEPATEARAAKLAALTLVLAEKRILAAVESAVRAGNAELPATISDVEGDRRHGDGNNATHKRAKH